MCIMTSQQVVSVALQMKSMDKEKYVEKFQLLHKSPLQLLSENSLQAQDNYDKKKQRHICN